MFNYFDTIMPRRSITNIQANPIKLEANECLCLRCQKAVIPKNVTIIQNGNNCRLSGTCPICRANVSKFCKCDDCDMVRNPIDINKKHIIKTEDSLLTIEQLSNKIDALNNKINKLNNKIFRFAMIFLLYQIGKNIKLSKII